MGAKHVINPNQLTLFERAGDLADPDHFYPYDALSDAEEPVYDGYTHSEIRNEVKNSKLHESMTEGLYDSVMRNGVKEPVSVVHIDDTGYGSTLASNTGTKASRGVLADGHHRVYSQADIDPEALVPVKWD